MHDKLSQRVLLFCIIIIVCIKCPGGVEALAFELTDRYEGNGASPFKVINAFSAVMKRREE